jgi:hypothetical protein
MPGFLTPTPKRDWVSVGDRCTATPEASMTGIVLRIVPTSSTPYAVVQWPTSVGRHTITTLRRVS